MAKKFDRFIKQFKQEKGQSVIILAFAFMGLVAMLGLALDLGLVYIERVALKRAIDAAVLSGVIELPNEEDAGVRALEYLALNGYDPAVTKVYFAGCLRISGTSSDQSVANNYVYQGSSLTENQIRNTFWIDTFDYRGTPAPNSADICNNTLFGAANKIRVRGQVKVDMNFMQFFGFDTVTVGDAGTAQNIDNLDIAVVFDRSGSMEFDPVCYGCWNRTATPNCTNDPNDPRFFCYYNYPLNGSMRPVDWNDADRARVCNPNPPVAQTVYTYPSVNGSHYIIMEAELYGRTNTSISTAYREQDKGYWALQRGEGNYDNSPPFYQSTGSSIDSFGAHMAHHPSLTSYGGVKYGHHYTLAEAQSANAPSLEYDFRFRNGGSVNWINGTNAWIWVRIHAGRGLQSDVNSGSAFDDEFGRTDAYWTVVGDTNYTAMNDPNFNPNTRKTVKAINGPQAINQIPDDTGTGWKWVRLEDPVVINTGQVYRIYIYAGSTAISLDQLLVTNNPNQLPTNPFNQPTIPQATGGSASRAACDQCNPIYGLNITNPGTQCTFLQYNEPINHANDPLFGEWESPMRTAKEAVKVFVTKLDPKRDQVGLASFNSGNTPSKTQLRCLQSDGPNVCPTRAISYTEVLRDIESVQAGGGTNIGAGMKGGLEVLGYNVYNQTNPPVMGDCGGGNQTCSRGSSAQRIMILMTDGVPNNNPGGACQNGGPTWDGGVPSGSAQNDLDCPLYFAQQAALNGIRVYVIGLGYGVNSDYLKTIADLGRGRYYFSANGSDLDLIFAEILNNIYVRLVE